MFGSFGSGFGSFGSGVSRGSRPFMDTLLSWLRRPTIDGKTLPDSDSLDPVRRFFSTVNYYLDSLGNAVRNYFYETDITAAKLEAINCISVTNGDTITITGLSSSTTVSSVSSGSVTPTVTTNTLTFGSTGFCSNIVLSDGTHLPLAEGQGNKVYDISGNSNHGTLFGTTWTTQNDIASLNHLNGFTKNIFKGYKGYWFLRGDGSSNENIWTIDDNKLVCTGNVRADGSTASNAFSKRPSHSVPLVRSGDTITISGKVTITRSWDGPSSSKLWLRTLDSGAWTNPSGYKLCKSGEGTGTFEINLTSNSDTTGSSAGTNQANFITFMFENANGTIEDLKITIDKPIPALDTKTKQIATFDGVNDNIFIPDSGQNSVFDFGTNDFILEGRADLTHVDNISRGLIGKYHTSGDDRSWLVYITHNGDLQLNTSPDGTFTNAALATVAKANVPQEVCDWKVVKSGTTATFYINGSQATQSSTAAVANIYSSVTATLVGAWNYGFAGQFKNVMESVKVSSSGIKPNDPTYMVKHVEYDFSGNIGSSTLKDISQETLDINGTFANNASGWVAQKTSDYGYTGDALSQVGEGFIRIISNQDNMDTTTYPINTSIQTVNRYNTLIVGNTYKLTGTVGTNNIKGVVVTQTGSGVDKSFIPHNPADNSTHTITFVANRTYLQLKRSSGGTGTPVDVTITNLVLEDITESDGTARDGAVTMGAAGVEGFWSKRIADTSGSIVSAGYQYGNTNISNPNGFVHNNSECSIAFQDGTGITKTASDIASYNNNSADRTFFKKDENNNVTQALNYEAALTGDALNKTRNYVD
tara:strand:- start:3130 stop:5574 length:2445 start_codon:yes stop_codon:yes gene_type:complete